MGSEVKRSPLRLATYPGLKHFPSKQHSPSAGNFKERNSTSSPSVSPSAGVCASPARARGMPKNSTKTCVTAYSARRPITKYREVVRTRPPSEQPKQSRKCTLIVSICSLTEQARQPTVHTISAHSRGKPLSSVRIEIARSPQALQSNINT